jgi:hypothetical protein
MPSVEVAALPGFTLLVTTTSRHHLYVRKARTRSVTRLRKTPEIGDLEGYVADPINWAVLRRLVALLR